MGTVCDLPSFLPSHRTMAIFAAVEFISTRSVGVISTEWFVSENEDRCFYPSTSDRRQVQRLVTQHSSPTPSWKSYDVKVLFKTGKTVMYIHLDFIFVI